VVTSLQLRQAVKLEVNIQASQPRLPIIVGGMVSSDALSCGEAVDCIVLSRTAAIKNSFRKRHDKSAAVAVSARAGCDRDHLGIRCDKSADETKQGGVCVSTDNGRDH
jgi:hypothetical protein